MADQYNLAILIAHKTSAAHTKAVRVMYRAEQGQDIESADALAVIDQLDAAREDAMELLENIRGGE